MWLITSSLAGLVHSFLYFMCFLQYILYRLRIRRLWVRWRGCERRGRRKDIWNNVLNNCIFYRYIVRLQLRTTCNKRRNSLLPLHRLLLSINSMRCFKYVYVCVCVCVCVCECICIRTFAKLAVEREIFIFLNDPGKLTK